MKLTVPYPVFTPLTTRMESMQLTSPLLSPDKHLANQFLGTSHQFTDATRHRSAASAFDDCELESGGDKPMDGSLK